MHTPGGGRRQRQRQQHPKQQQQQQQQQQVGAAVETPQSAGGGDGEKEYKPSPALQPILCERGANAPIHISPTLGKALVAHLEHSAKILLPSRSSASSSSSRLGTGRQHEVRERQPSPAPPPDACSLRDFPPLSMLSVQSQRQSGSLPKRTKPLKRVAPSFVRPLPAASPSALGEDQQQEEEQDTEVMVRVAALAGAYAEMVVARMVPSVGSALAVLLRLLTVEPGASDKEWGGTASLLLSNGYDCRLFSRAALMHLLPLLRHLGSPLLSGAAAAAAGDPLLSQALRRAAGVARDAEPPEPVVAGAGAPNAFLPDEDTQSGVPAGLRRNRQLVLDSFTTALRGAVGFGVGRDRIRSEARRILQDVQAENRRWFARFFIAQLLGMGLADVDTGEEAEMDAEVVALSGGDGRRLKQLRRRLTEGAPGACPDTFRPNSTGEWADQETRLFPGPRQQFLAAFLIEGDSFAFSSHLSRALRASLSEEWALRQEVTGSGAFADWLGRMRALARFSGLVAFYSNWGGEVGEGWPPGALSPLEYLQGSEEEGLLAACVPWVADYLRTASKDPSAAQSMEFADALNYLRSVAALPILSAPAALITLEVEHLLRDIGAPPIKVAEQQIEPNGGRGQEHVPLCITRRLMRCCPCLTDLVRAASGHPPEGSTAGTAAPAPAEASNKSRDKEHLDAHKSHAPGRSHPVHTALVDTFFHLHPELWRIADIVVRESPDPVNPENVAAAVKLLAPPSIHPRAVEVAAILAARHSTTARRARNATSSVRVQPKKGKRQQEQDSQREVDDVIRELLAGELSPTSAEDWLFDRPLQEQNRVVKAYHSFARDTPLYHPLQFSRLLAAQAERAAGMPSNDSNRDGEELPGAQQQGIELGWGPPPATRTGW
jgi:hypothetical protein